MNSEDFSEARETLSKFVDTLLENEGNLPPGEEADDLIASVIFTGGLLVIDAVESLGTIAKAAKKEWL